MELVLLGLSLGLAAGVSPGPLLTLTLTATLERGFGAGLRVAIAPLLSDLPVVVLSLGVLAAVPTSFLGSLALFGGAFVVYLGIDALRKGSDSSLVLPTQVDPDAEPASVDLVRGALVNVLNPNPWIFWLTVGAPQTVGLWRGHSPWHAVTFVTLFYVGLVGSKVVIAAAAARGRRRLAGPWYRRLLMGCGVALVALGVVLMADGWRRLRAEPEPEVDGASVAGLVSPATTQHWIASSAWHRPAGQRFEEL